MIAKDKVIEIFCITDEMNVCGACLQKSCMEKCSLTEDIKAIGTFLKIYLSRTRVGNRP